MRSFAKSWVFQALVLALAGSGLSLTAATQVPSTADLPSALDSPKTSGWVLTDLNGDKNVDLATARSGRHDASGYAQEVRVTMGAFRETSFHFLSTSATVELSSRDVDGDDDRDLIVFEPLSSQPIGVWINDGAGSFHEGRLADFRKLWSERPGSAWRVRFQKLALFAISEERAQTLTPPAAIAAPELVVTCITSRNETAQRDPRRCGFRPRAPPQNS